MTKGQVVRTTDVTSAISTKVSNYLPSSNPGGKTSFSGSRTSILNAVKSKCNVLDGMKGKTIKADDVKTCIIDSMYEACCCGTQTYSMYQHHVNKNTPYYRPPTTTYGPYRGMYSSKNVTKTTYISSENSGVTELNSSVVPGKVISAVKLTDILDKFVAYNRSTESNKYLGLLDTCYTSCHTSCHGSSRSRR